MLEYMQKHARWFLLPFAGIIVVSFIFFGVGGMNDSNKVRVVAEVGPYKIDAQSYWLNYEKMRDFYRNILQDQFTEEMQKNLDLKNKALEQMIERDILLIAANENNVRVSDSELGEAIKNDQTFWREGSFNRDVYLNTLRLNRYTPKQYEESRREDIAVERIRKMILAAYAPIPDIGSEEEKPASDPAAEAARQKAYRAFIEAYKKRLEKQGRFKVDLSLIS